MTKRAALSGACWERASELSPRRGRTPACTPRKPAPETLLRLKVTSRPVCLDGGFLHWDFQC